MRRVLAISVLIVMILAALQQPASAYLAPYAAPSPTPLRAAPSADAAQVGMAYPGGDFDVVETTADGWSAVMIGGEKYWLAPGAVAPAQQPRQVMATITTSLLNVRKGPGTQYAVVTTVKKGQQVPVLEQGDGWAKISVGSASGWIASRYVQLVQTATQVPAVHFDKQAHVVVDRANIRTGTNTGYNVKWRVTKGTTLPVYSTAGGWLQVINRNDLGWIEGSLVSVEDKGRTNPGVTYSVSENHWRINFPAFGTVTGSKVNLRTGAGTKYKSVAQVRKGARLESRGNVGDWARVVWQGQECYVARAYFKVDAKAEPRSITFDLDGQKKRLSMNNMGAVSMSRTDDGLGMIFRLPVRLPQAQLDIGTGEFKSLIVDGDIVALTLGQRPSYSIESSGPNTSVSFTSRLTAITWKQGVDRDSISFVAAGSLPGDVIGAQPAAILLGAIADIASLPGPLAGTVTPFQGGSKVEFATQPGSMVLRHSPAEITIDLLKPGLRGRTIVIDAGHGGRDPGAIGVNGGKEKDINLAIALALRDRLKAAGATVVMTRETDTTVVPPDESDDIEFERQVSISELARRSNMAAQNRGDMFISIHNNSMGYSSDQSGTETYYYSGASNSPSAQRLAAIVQHEMVVALGLRDRGVKDEQFYVIKNADAPAILVEGAFLSNAVDAQLLADPVTQGLIADGLFQAISEYFGPDAGTTQQ